MWLDLLPSKARGHRIEHDTYVSALALMLGLPFAGFEGTRCECGAHLDAESGEQHAAACKRFEKTTRHNTFGKRTAEAVVCSLPPKGRGKVVKGLPLDEKDGLSLGFHTRTKRDGTLVTKEVFPDTSFRGLAGKSPAWTGHIDYTVVDPRAKKYRIHAAKQPLHAANKAHRHKQRLYTSPQLQRPNQEVFIIAAELFGGLAKPSDDLLRGWAREFTPQGAGHLRASHALLRAWRLEMALGLLEARVGAVYAAQAKLRASGLRAAGVTDSEQRRELRVYDVVARRSVTQEYAEMAREATGFLRAVLG